MEYEHYQALLRDFAAAVGVPDVAALLESQELRVDDLVVSFTLEAVDEHSHALTVFAGFEPPADIEAAALDQLLLEANHLWRGTAGATFSRNPDTGAVFLAASTPADTLTGEHLARLCGVFVDVLGTWRDLLRAGPGGQAPQFPLLMQQFV